MTGRRPVRVGLAGCGYIAQRVHLPTLARLPEAELVAVCDADPQRAEATARRFSVARWYTDAAEMTRREGLALVDVCTPPPAHAAVIADVLAAGAHCLVEKPLTTTTADADAVISLAEEQSLGIFVTHNVSRVLPAVRKVREIVDSGAVGRLIGADVKLLVPFERRHLHPGHWLHGLPGDVVFEVLPHMLMLLLEFLDGVRDVKVVAAKLSPHDYIGTDEIRALLEAGNGLGALTISSNCPSRRTTLDIVGTRMSVHADLDSQAVVTYPPHPGTEYALYRGWRALREILQRSASLGWTAANVLTGRYTALSHGHRRLIRRALLAVQRGAPYPIDIGRCREVVRVGEMIQKQVRPVREEAVPGR